MSLFPLLCSFIFLFPSYSPSLLIPSFLLFSTLFLTFSLIAFSRFYPFVSYFPSSDVPFLPSYFCLVFLSYFPINLSSLSIFSFLVFLFSFFVPCLFMFYLISLFVICVLLPCLRFVCKVSCSILSFVSFPFSFPISLPLSFLSYLVLLPPSGTSLFNTFFPFHVSFLPCLSLSFLACVLSTRQPSLLYSFFPSLCPISPFCVLFPSVTV